MGLRSQFGSLVELERRWRGQADFYLVYGREAFPSESRWPAPVPDGEVVSAPTSLAERSVLAERFRAQVSDHLPLLLDGLDDAAMAAYDAYPFRVYGITPTGRIAVPSAKGAAGFSATLERIDRWLKSVTGEAATTPSED
ncbi:MAG: hypothetical protein AAF604_21210 [Acidobacteriota bacterium]